MDDAHIDMKDSRSVRHFARIYGFYIRSAPIQEEKEALPFNVRFASCRIGPGSSVLGTLTSAA